MSNPTTLGAALSEGYGNLFRKQWPFWVAGIILGATNVFMFAFLRPWSAADGVRNWGDWFSNTIGTAEKIIIDPYLYSTSILNFGIIFGALVAALLASQFQIRIAPVRELFKGILGGLLMGVGAGLAFGCNIGGFFSATSALSLAGLVMMVGLIIGAYIGLKLIVWEVEYISPPTWGVRVSKPNDGKQSRSKIQPYFGLLALLVWLILVFVYDGFDYSERGVILSFGLFIGIVMQRSRFCFVRAFREPFMTGKGDATKAVALAVIISATGFAILKWTDLREWETLVQPAFWMGSLSGGIIFGIGMCIAGGCATGSLWRAGEGHIKLWLAVISFALSASYFSAWLSKSGWIMKLGERVFLPDYMDWKFAYLTVIGIMLLWMLLATWNEITKKFVV